MIWIALATCLTIAFAALLTPLFKSSHRIGQDEELAEAKAQLAKLDADIKAGVVPEDAGEIARRSIEERVADLLSRQEGDAQTGNLLVGQARAIVPVIVVLSTIGLYLTLGEPDFAAKEVESRQIAALRAESPPLPVLVERLQSTLASDPNPPPQGYLMLARSLMTLGRFDEAYEAYGTLLELTDNDPRVADELAQARAYGDGQDATGALAAPSQDMIDAAEQMTPEQRMVMVQGMVDGLAARLEDDPSNIDGWLRLIRSRVVLGDVGQAEADLATARAQFEDGTPEAEALTSLAEELNL